MLAIPLSFSCACLLLQLKGSLKDVSFHGWCPPIRRTLADQHFKHFICGRIRTQTKGLSVPHTCPIPQSHCSGEEGR